MKKILALCSVIAFVLLFVGPLNSQDQAKAQPQKAENAVTAYRLNFSVNELEDGKRLNTRSYTMNLKGGDGNEIKIGTRVPVEAKQGEFQYIDVGTNIFCRLKETGNDLSLEVRGEFSNFAVPDQQSHISMPVLRQFSIRGSTIAVLGKPVMIGSVDDPNSKRQFELEVTVSKLR